MTAIQYYDNIENDRLKFAVIISRYQNKWVFCKHKERDTYEFPGGHREPGEWIDTTARRELWEETGADQYDLHRVTPYSVRKDFGEETYGMLYFAEIHKFGALPAYEITEIKFLDDLPENMTYPLIQPVLLERVKKELQNFE